MKPEDVTIEAIEEVYGYLASEWEGNCFSVATAAAKLVPGAVAVYGHYHGPVSRDGYWAVRAGLPFQAHGWVLLEDGKILDPTRWSFMAVDPFIHLGLSRSNDDYDEGGNAWRSLVHRPPPPWEWPAKTFSFESITSKDDARYTAIASLIGKDQVRFGAHLVLTKKQAFWLANLPIEVFGVLAHPIYEALGEVGLAGFVPQDNRVRAEREYRSTQGVGRLS